MYSNNMYGNNPYGVYNPAPIQMPPQKQEVDRVNGRNGAEMYRMAPDSSAIVLDANDPMIWFIQTDSAGYKSIIPYDIAPHEEAKMPDAKTIDERMNGFDERLRAIEEALK